MKRFAELPQRQGQNLALTVLYVPSSLHSGHLGACRSEAEYLAHLERALLSTLLSGSEGGDNNYYTIGVIRKDGERWALVKSHDERRWSCEELTQSRTLPIMPESTKIYSIREVVSFGDF